MNTKRKLNTEHREEILDLQHYVGIHSILLPWTIFLVAQITILYSGTVNKTDTQEIYKETLQTCFMSYTHDGMEGCLVPLMTYIPILNPLH